MSKPEQTFFNSTQARELIDVYGFAIFPVHGVVDGQCTCSNPDCKHKGKHPATPNGFQDASKDIERVKQMWAARKGLNVGIATGTASGIFVIDIDGPVGVESINAMIEEYGPLPVTLTSKTANGHHLLFRHPGGTIRSRGNMLPKVDVRGDGGYIVGPYSNHASGAKYGFVNPIETIATAPAWLVDLVIKDTKSPTGQPLQIAPEYQPRLNILSLSDKWSQADVERLLDHISPDLPYHDWFQIGMAIKDYGLPFEVWDRWSARGAKYVRGEMPAKWNSFKGTGVTMGTLVHFAKQGGWEPERKSEPVRLDSRPQVNYNLETGEIIETVEPALDPSSPHPQQAAQTPFPWLEADDIKPVINVADFVEGTLRDGEMSVIYGRPNCGKTFFMVDLSLHIALGRQWNGREIEQGPVVYVSMEGASGIRNRITAFKRHHYISESIPLVVIPQAFSMMNKDDALNFLKTLSLIEAKHGKPRLIVIDTLARAMAGGDENSTKDMSLFVANCDAVRQYTTAHLCVIHHSGKDDTRGARGSSALLGGIDTEIELKRDNDSRIVTVSVTKQREMEPSSDLFYQLETVVLGADRRGKNVTSCVVMPVNADDVKGKKKNAKLIPEHDLVLNSLRNTIAHKAKNRHVLPDMKMISSVTREEFKEELVRNGFYSEISPEQAKYRLRDILNSLKQKGLCNFTQLYIWLPNG